MKALKTTGVQILIVGIILCCGMVLLFMWAGNKFEYDGATVISLTQIVVGVFAAGFCAIPSLSKGRDIMQSSKGQYFDESENKLKKIE